MVKYFIRRRFSCQGKDIIDGISLDDVRRFVALFSPLRKRVQRAIDRRFYRQRYNAEKILSSFAETARDEVNLDELTAELLNVTQKSLPPETVSLWLSPSPARMVESKQ